MTGWKIIEELMHNFDINFERLLQDMDLEKRNNPGHEYLDRIIRKACEIIFPAKKKTIGKRKRVHWWNEEIRDARILCLKKKRILIRASKKPRVTEVEKENLRQEYRRQRTILKNKIKELEKKAWKLFCSEVDDDVWGLIYKIVCRKQPRTTLEDDRIREVVQELFPRDDIIDWEDITIEEETVPFTVEAIYRVGKRMKARKAPGPDGVPPEIIKRVAADHSCM